MGAAYNKNFLHLSQTWMKLAAFPEYRQRFQNQLFPEKVTYDGKKFGTKKMSLVYELNQSETAETSNLVTLPGIEPGLTA